MNAKKLVRQNWEGQEVVSIETKKPIWNHFYMISPLVIIGTKEKDHYDLAPKHMAMAIGQENYFGFVCTPKHATYHNVRDHGYFSVSFPKPDQMVLAGLAAAPRCGEETDQKKMVELLPTVPAPRLDSLFIKNAYLYLECVLHQIIDGFGEYSLITGKITGAYVDLSYLKVSDKDQQHMIQKAPLPGFLAYSRFTIVEDSFAFPMPKDFIHIDD